MQEPEAREHGARLVGPRREVTLQVDMRHVLASGHDLMVRSQCGYRLSRSSSIEAETADVAGRNVDDVATSLNGYDQAAYLEGSESSFTRFCLPRVFDAAYRLADDAVVMWQAFEDAHHRASLQGRLGAHTVLHSGYVQSRDATGRVLATVKSACGSHDPEFPDPNAR